MNYQKVKTNFIYPKIEKQHYRFGSNNFADVVLRPNGDWRDYPPEAEEQNKWGVESSACYVYAPQHAVETIQEERFGLINEDYSARFNALKSNGTEYGGDPLAAGESMRNDGLIPEALMPFSEIIKSWNDYHSWKGTDQQKCEEVGKKFTEDWKLNYDIVFERDETVEVKYQKLREALKRSPVPISVLAWYSDAQGIFTKPEGTQDNHLTLCVYVDEQNRPYFWDTYSPFLKIGEPFYNSDFAMRWHVEKKEASNDDEYESTDIGSVLIKWFKYILKFFKIIK